MMLRSRSSIPFASMKVRTPLKLEQAVHEGLIEYIAFPDGLEDKYQAYTQADLRNLRAGGCDVEFRRVEQGTASYVRWLLGQAP